MSGDKDLTNTQNDGIIFSVRVDLTERDGFVVVPEPGVISPAVADMILALQVAQDTVMNEYYTNMSNSMTPEEDTQFVPGVEGVVKKAEGHEV